MAENALYISSVEQVKPTIFELIAQESLLGTLQPSFTLLCKVLRIKFNQRLQWFFKYQEEWYLLINLLIQTHYMRVFKASFSEAFYGLKRIPIDNKSKKLSAYSKTMTLFCLVGLPYLSVKVKRIIDEYQLKIDADSCTQQQKKVYKPVVLSYKTVNTFYELAKLYCLLAYLSGHSYNHSPLLKLSRVKLVYHSIEVPTWHDLMTDYFKNKKRLSTILLPAVFKFFSQFLEISAFTVQFLNWWHSDEVKTKLNILPIPPPLNTINNRQLLCPICNKKRKVEVVLQSSGYVYCYRCIKEVLQKTGKCPVTNLPASTDQLIRIYTEK